MANTVIVNFSNGGDSSAHYVVENAVLGAEFGAPLIGSPAISDVVTGGAIAVTNPLVSGDYDDTGSLDEAYLFGVDEWNAVKNISARASGSNSMLFIADNFVHADLDFSDVTDTVELRVSNGKRSNILTGEADDKVEISTATNKASWSNEHRVETGAGDDIVTVKKGDLSGGAIIKYVDGHLTTVIADLGEGDDYFGADDEIKTMDHVNGGKGADRIFTGGGDDVIEGGEDRGEVIYDEVDDLYVMLSTGDVLRGGTGADEFIYTSTDGFANLGDGFDYIVDFADEDVLTLNLQGGDVVTTETVTLATEESIGLGVDAQLGTMVFINDEASVFLEGFTNTSEIFV